MTEKTIQSLETAMENIAHDIEIETNGVSADYKDIMIRVHAMERMNKLIPEERWRGSVELVSLPDLKPWYKKLKSIGIPEQPTVPPMPEHKQEEG
jgi:hypothetical protein